MSNDSLYSWTYPSAGSAPSTPIVVDGTPDYFASLPTPPTTPKVPATWTADDDTPCPPSPQCAPRYEEDETEWSDATESETSSDDSDSDDTSSVDPLTVSFSDDACDTFDETYGYPNPISIMIERATLDVLGLRCQPVNSWTCRAPSRLSATHIPVAGFDERIFDEHAGSVFSTSLPTESLRCCFSIGTIQELQHNFRVREGSVDLEPIPPVIVRSQDIVGRENLTQRNNSFVFVVPNEDSIWDTILQRGIDKHFRPLNSSANVKASCSSSDDAIHPHAVASQFAVNVFLESESEGPIRSCEYLGAFVLQIIDRVTKKHSGSSSIELVVKRSILSLIPYRTEESEDHFRGKPSLSCVCFLYYKWDEHILRLANDLRDHCTTEPCRARHPRPQLDVRSSPGERLVDPAPSTLGDPETLEWIHQDVGGGFAEPDYEAYLNLSSCE